MGKPVCHFRNCQQEGMVRVVSIMVFFFSFSTVIAQTFINPSLEQWGDSTICETNLPPDDWFDFSNAGIAPDEANYPLCPSSIPGRASDGRVYARFMAGNPVSGEGMHQIVLGFAVGRTYHISFDYAGSNRWGGSDSCHFKLFLNGVVTDSTPVFSSRDTSWRRFDCYFIAPATAIDFGVRALVPHYGGSGGSAAIDNFSFQESIAGVPESDFLADIAVHPNPFTDHLSVEARSWKPSHVQITDLSGRAVRRFDIEENTLLDVSGLGAGVYLLSVYSDAGAVRTMRLVK